MRVSPMQKRSNVRVKHIKEVALRMFREDPLSIDAGMIAREANITRTSMYRYFDSASAIAASIFADHANKVLETDYKSDWNQVIFDTAEYMCDIPETIYASVNANPNAMGMAEFASQLYTALNLGCFTEEEWLCTLNIAARYGASAAYGYMSRLK